MHSFGENWSQGPPNSRAGEVHGMVLLPKSCGMLQLQTQLVTKDVLTGVSILLNTLQLSHR